MMTKPSGGGGNYDPLYPLSDGGATHNVTNHEDWIVPLTRVKSTVGNFSGCETGGGITADTQGSVAMVVSAIPPGQRDYKAIILFREWQYAPKVSENLFGESFEKRKHGSTFEELRDVNGDISRHMVLRNGTKVLTPVDNDTCLSYLKLLVNPSLTAKLASRSNGHEALSIMLGHLNGEIVDPIPKSLLSAKAKGGLQLAKNTAMTRISFTPSESLSIAHSTYSHATINALNMSAYCGSITNIKKMRPTDAKGFIAAGCDICNSVKMIRPAVPARPSGQPAPKPVEGERRALCSDPQGPELGVCAPRIKSSHRKSLHISHPERTGIRECQESRARV